MSSFIAFLLLSVPSDPAVLCSSPLPEEINPKMLDITELDAVIAAQPDCMQAHYLRASATLGEEDRDTEVALKHLERAAELAPKNSRVLRLSGQVYLMRAQENTSLSDARQGKKLLEKAVEANPEDLDARSALAGFHRAAPWIAGGDMDDAYEQAEEIRKRDLKRGLLEQARTLRADGKEDKALELVRNTIESFPDYMPMIMDYAILMHSQEDFAEAHRVLLAITRNDDADLNALYQLGRTAALSGEFIDDGRSALQRYLARGEAGDELPIEPAAALWRLGMIEQHAGRIDAARAAFENALAANPGYKQAAEALQKL